MKKCKACGYSKKLVNHHTHYAGLHGALLDKTIILCERCHNLLHKFVRGKDPDLPTFTDNFVKGRKFWGKTKDSVEHKSPTEYLK